MRIQHNIMAMNAYRNYNNNSKSLSSNLEKLSSGYKINRAGDDAAGLAISEKMRAQITGLDAAQKNVKDGISLVKTGEGAMQEIQDMLNRMDYLATQSANGTYQNEVDRENLNKEVTALKTEINRIADSANFNGIKLLDGSLSAKGGSVAVSNINLDGNLTGITTVDATKWKMTSQATSVINQTNLQAMSVGDRMEMNFTYVENGQEKTVTLGLTAAQNSDGTQYLVSDSGQEYSLTSDAIASGTAADLNKALSNEIRKSGLEDKFTFTANWGTDGAIVAEAKEAGANGAKLIGVSEAIYDKTGNATTAPTSGTMTQTTQGEDAYYTATPPALYDGTNQNDAVFTVNGKKYMLATDGQDVTGVDKDITIVFGQDAENAVANAASKISQDTGLNVTSTGATNLTFKAGTGTTGKGGLKLQIGDTADSFNQMVVSIGDMHTKALGIDGVDISNQDGAASATQTIKDAINMVSSVRGDLGAIQNRLEHTQNNLSVMAENIQDAESTIRDTDVAEEMMSYTKNNILVQSAQAMLAQANQVPQGVLQLLG
ncbi:MAG: flagellin [Oscillospiraceae bacterium]|jgi:flagellin|nr:flagellin [Oscillospiraceae bacterium]